MIGATRGKELCIFFFLKEGDVFGELSFFTGKIRETSALSMGYTKLFTLCKSEFLQVLQEDAADYVGLYLKIRVFFSLFIFITQTKTRRPIA